MKSRLLIAAMLIALVSGCVRIEVGGARKPTLGSQIIDLYRAEQAGAITEQQFRSLSAQLFAATVD